MFFETFSKLRHSTPQKKSVLNEKLPPLSIAPLGRSNVAPMHFDVCPECQDHLMHTFAHCLHKNMQEIDEARDFKLSSIGDVDEWEDGLTVTTPPEYNLVPDPSVQATKPVTINAGKKVENTKEKNQAGNSAGSAGGTPKGKRIFQGPVFRMVLQAKNREIATLKKQLYETSLVEKLEAGNVEKLQKALGKAVKYYAFAEEWKDHETMRLREDVKFLKSYISSLMAYMMAFDEEKYTMKKQLEQVNTTAEEYTKRIAEKDEKIKELKERLQVTFRDYLSLSEEHEALKTNSANSKELNLANQKLEAITSQYQLMSKDIAAITKNLEDKVLQCQQQEFELTELTRQFEQMGKEKASLMIQHRDLQLQNKNTKSELEELKKTHASVVENRNYLYNELENLKLTHQQWKLYNEKELKQRDDKIVADKALYDALVEKQNNTQNDLVKALETIKELQEALANNQKLLMNTRESFGEEGKKKDASIAKLQQSEALLKKELGKMKEDKEALIIKVNSLKQAFDNEVSQGRMLSLEIKEIKKASEEMNGSLTVEKEKLQKQKDQLSIDKEQLVEEVRRLRGALEVQQGEFRSLTKEYEQGKNEWSEKEDVLRLDLNETREQLEMSNKHLATYKEDFKKASEGLVRFKVQNAMLSKELEEQVGKLSLDYSKLKEEYDKLLVQQAEDTETIRDITERLELLILEHRGLTREHEELKTLTGEDIKKKLADIKALEAEREQLQGNVARLEELSASLADKLRKTKEELEMTFNRQQEERKMREMAESNWDHTLQSVTNERMLRHEVQEILFNAEKERQDQQQGLSNLVKQRKMKMAQVWTSLKEEFTRVDEFLKNMPQDSSFDFIKIRTTAS